MRHFSFRCLPSRRKWVLFRVFSASRTLLCSDVWPLWLQTQALNTVIRGLGFSPTSLPSPGVSPLLASPPLVPHRAVASLWTTTQTPALITLNEKRSFLSVSPTKLCSFRAQPGYIHWSILWDDSTCWINEWKNEWMISQISSDKLWLKWKWSLGPSDTQNICILKTFHQRN